MLAVAMIQSIVDTDADFKDVPVGASPGEIKHAPPRRAVGIDTYVATVAFTQAILRTGEPKAHINVAHRREPAESELTTERRNAIAGLLGQRARQLRAARPTCVCGQLPVG